MANADLSPPGVETGLQRTYHLPTFITKPESIKRLPDEVFCEILDLLFSENVFVCYCDEDEPSSDHEPTQTYVVLLSCAYMYSIGLPLYYSNCTLQLKTRTLAYDRLPKALLQNGIGLDLYDLRYHFPGRAHCDLDLSSFGDLKRLRLPHDIIKARYDHQPSDDEILAARGVQDQVDGGHTAGLIASQFPLLIIRCEYSFTILAYEGVRRIHEDLYAEIEVQGANSIIKSKRVVPIVRQRCTLTRPSRRLHR